MKKLLLSLGLLLALSLTLTGCNNDTAKAQVDEIEDELDFLIDVISGAVLENTEGDGFILELEVSPITVFIAESPSFDSGTINTEAFLENFIEIFGDDLPNAILTFRDGDGIAVAVAVRLNSIVFDAEESVAQFFVTQLDDITESNPPGTAIELMSLTTAPAAFASAFLYIDGTTLDDADVWIRFRV